MKTYKSKMISVSLVMEKSDFPKVKIQNAKDAYDVIRKFYHEDVNIYESMFILLLNKANNTIGYAKISQGGVAGTVVDNKLIAKYALECLASGVILCHNHPSGNLAASVEDINITNKIVKALKLLDITLLDHIIISDYKFYSFNESGLL